MSLLSTNRREGVVGGFAVILLVALPSALGQGNLDFSLDPASPKVPGSFSDADDIEAGGTDVRIPEADLGAGGAGVIGLSYGQAEAADVDSPYYYKRLAYSVDRNAVGNGAPIATEVAIDGAAGDTFALDFVGVGSRRFVLRSPFNLAKAQLRDLTVKTDPADPEDDIDALSLFRTSEYPVFLTFPPGSGFDPATIYIVRSMGGPPEVFATPAQLGLVPGDVIDAFALGSIPFGGPPPTALNPNVVIWVSLATGSPTRGGADSIIQVWPQPGGTVLTANHLNLGPNDEVNAIAVLDPSRRPIVTDSWIFDGTSPAAIGRGPGAGGAAAGKISSDVVFGLADAYSNINYWPRGGTARSFSITPNGSGRIQAGAVGIVGTELLVELKVAAEGGVIFGPGGLPFPVGGSSIVSLDASTDPPGVNFIDDLSPGPSVFLSNLDRLGGAGVFVAGTILGATGGPVAVGGIDLNAGTTFPQALCLVTEVGSDGLIRPRGLVIEALADGTVRPVTLYSGGILAGTPNEVYIAVATDGRDLRIRNVSPTGLGAPVTIPNVAPLGLGATLIIKLTIGESSVDVGPIIPLQPSPGSTSYPEVRDLVVTNGSIWAPVNAGSGFDLFSETYGEANNPNSFVFHIATSGSPELIAHFETDSTPGVRIEISGMALNPLIGDIGLTLNTLVDAPGARADFRLINPANGSAAALGFPGDAIGINTAAICIHAATHEIGPINLRARPFNLGDSHPYVFFVGIVPCRSGFMILGATSSPDPVLDPTQTVFPVTVSATPGEARQIIAFVVESVTPGIGGAAIDVGLIPPNFIQIDWSGDRLVRWDPGTASWVPVDGATNPHIEPATGDVGLFRSELD